MHPLIDVFRDGYAAELSEMFRASIFAAGPDHYSAEQVSKWASRMPTAKQLITKCHDGRTALVAFDEHERAIAFADLEPNGHLDFLFCHPDYIGKGVASKLSTIWKQTRNSSVLQKFTLRPVNARDRYFCEKAI